MAALPSRVTAGRHRRVAAAALLAIAAVALMQEAPHAQPPRPGSRPSRIVSLVPAVTEMLFAIGDGDRVVGVSSYDRFPPEVRRLPPVGGLLDPNVEGVLALRPDLAIVYATQREFRTQLARAGVPQFEYVHRDLADVTSTLRAVGRRVGAATAAERLASDIERQLADIQQRVQGRRRPKTLLVFGREPGTLRRIHASGGYGFLHDLVQVAGGDDVLGDVHRESAELSTETVLARAPEVIIELKYGQSIPLTGLERLEREWDTLAAVPAVRQRRVHVLVGDEFVVPGPRVATAAKRLAELLHPSGQDTARVPTVGGR